MATNRKMHIKCLLASVLIHGILLSIFLSSHTHRHPLRMIDAIMIVPMDGSDFPPPIDENKDLPTKPKQPVATPKLSQAEQPIAPANQDSIEKEKPDPRSAPIPAAVENSGEQPAHDDLPKKDIVSTQAKGMAASINETSKDGFGNGDGIGTAAGSSFSSGGRAGGDKTGNGNTVQSAGRDMGNPGFGSPTGPRFLHRMMPEYPLAARKKKQEGKVVLAITIDLNGCLQHVKVIEASDPLFVQPAIDALKKSSFLPAIRNSAPITVTAILPIRFALKD